MSSSSHGNRNGKRAVQFADEPEGSNNRHKKRPRRDRPNADEADDVDEWQKDDDDDDSGLPSESELLHAKRDRKLKREVGEDDGDDIETTRVDNTTSLLQDKDGSSEIPVDPFNMNAERSDGTGFFDGDTYVFRKRGEQEEPDAWLESMDETKEVAKPRPAAAQSKGGEMDNWSRHQLYAKILPLVGEKETVLQALVRYGNLIKRQEKSGSGVAKASLNDLTEASNALLLQGDVDIYQQTRQDMEKLLPKSNADEATTPKPVVQWEYKGNQDGEIHGPYTTPQMLSWTQAGYFVGDQAVQIRTVRPQGSEPPKSAKEELLSDLMDDSDNDDEANKKAPPVVRGEWASSNDVNFAAYD